MPSGLPTSLLRCLIATTYILRFQLYVAATPLKAKAAVAAGTLRATHLLAQVPNAAAAAMIGFT